MALSKTSISRNVPLPMPVVVLTFISTIFSFTALALSIANLKSEGINSAPWFNIVIAIITLLFHGTIVLHYRQKPSYAFPISEKALNRETGSEQQERVLFTTTPVVMLVLIIFAVWVVAWGAALYQLLLKKSASTLDMGSIVIVSLEMVTIGVLCIYALIGKRHTGGSVKDSLSRSFKPMHHTLPSSASLPRPLVLEGSLKKKPSNDSISKSSISNPSPPPEYLPSKIAPVAMFGMTSPPATQPSPPAALTSEPRFNGMRTLVLVDPRMELASATSFHGTKVSSTSPPPVASIPVPV